MKKITCLILYSSYLVMVATAQSPKKSTPAPSMADVQKMMDNLPPEAKKIMDSMGISKKLLESVSNIKAKGLTDKQIQAATEDAGRLVPKKNNVLIKQANKRLQTETELKSFLNNWCVSIRKGLNLKTLTRFDALAVEMKSKSNGDEVTYTGIACMLMIADRPNLAIAAFTKEFLQRGISDYNDLNNFSSLCNSMGGPQVALPILNFMNANFPDNPVILNNIGQAWFICGEQDSAETFLKKSINILKFNPEANETISKIYIEQGKTKEAAEAIKNSLKTAYSSEKEDLAKKAGFKLTKDNYNLPARLKYDPLGFLNIPTPVFQKNMPDYYNCTAKYDEWSAALETELRKLKDDTTKLYKKINSVPKNDLEAFMAKINKFVLAGDRAAIVNAAGLNPIKLKMIAFLSENFDQTPEVLLSQLDIKLDKNKIDYEGRIVEIKKAAENINGRNECYTDQYNYELTNSNMAATEKMRKDINDIINYQTDALYYYMYSRTDEEFELIKATMKIEFLEYLLHTPKKFDKPGCIKQITSDGKITLVKWEDTHCELTRIDFKDWLGILDMKWDCDGSHLFVDSKVIKIRDEWDGSGNRIGNSSVWIGLTAGKQLNDKGSSIKIGGKITDGFYVEYNKDGITDVGVTIGAEIKVGPDLQKLGSVKNGDGEVVEGPAKYQPFTEIVKRVDKSLTTITSVKNETTNESTYAGSAPSLSFKVGSEIRLSFMDSGKNTYNATGSATIFNHGLVGNLSEGWKVK